MRKKNEKKSETIRMYSDNYKVIKQLSAQTGLSRCDILDYMVTYLKQDNYTIKELNSLAKEQGKEGYI